MKPIIEVNHVWKEYQKGIDRRYKSLRDTITSIPGRIFGEEKEKFWALEDIDFKVEAGESIGIIGKNGAGKSTLLKILSRITPPTKGEIVLRGRVASLLEVGTGFHPELTGRENIFFNGSILGMKNQEIKRKFDEIVDFSGVESFIDTPLKHYSSGMQMRLAFSVAAHLESEILLIDEVLAVGDAEFQKKCIGKMDDVSKGEGKTILFVSHQLPIIKKLCPNGILITNGSVALNGSIDRVIQKYQNQLNEKPYLKKNENQDVSIETFEVFNSLKKQMEYGSLLSLGDQLYIELGIRFNKIFDDVSIALDIRDINGDLFAHISNEDDGFYVTKKLDKSSCKLSILTYPIFFIPGDYHISLWVGKYHTFTLLREENIFKFCIEKGELSKRKGVIPAHSKTFLMTNWASINR